MEQGSEDWFKVRRGVPTASHFRDILADSDERKMRTNYLYNLAGERLSGLTAEDFTNEYMNRGKRMEPQALASYEMLNAVEIERVGFVKRGRVGCSPDGLVGAAGAIETKTMAPKLLIPIILKKPPPPNEHLPQCHGVTWICELDWCDLSLFWPGMRPTVYRINRDEDFLRYLAGECDRFCDDLDNLVYKLRGDPQKMLHEMELPR